MRRFVAAHAADGPTAARNVLCVRPRPYSFLVSLCATRGFATVASRLLPRLDLLAHRLTAGRLLVSHIAFPSLLLTTTGHRSGALRTVPLVCFPHPEGFFVIGTNFGRQHHPAWSTNLLHTPEASIHFRGRACRVVAHPLMADAEQDVLAALQRTGTSRVYESYRRRAGREIRHFDLRIVDGDGRVPDGTGRSSDALVSPAQPIPHVQQKEA
ncbi:nitroreductase family deazaflavin-dependent oxidoreductase [Streptomyces sp. NPDC002784]